MRLSAPISALCAAAFVIALAGCMPPGGDAPLDKSTIAVFANVVPVASNVASGATTYSAYCMFMYESGSGEVDVASAVVKINGVTLPNLASVGPYYFSSSNVGSLSTGDTVTLDISESRLGTIHASATVPVCVASFDLNPPLPAAGVQNTATSYDMSWVGNGADSYNCMCYFYDGTSTRHGGYGATIPGEIWTFASTDTYWDAANQDYLEFALETRSQASIPGFVSWSSLSVAGITRVTQNNVP